MVSTNVVVLPVPGGPNKMYGAGYAEQFKILFTAIFCSLFFAILLLAQSKSLYHISIY